MNKFDDFWNKHQQKYIDVIKIQAMNDFNIIYNSEKYSASANIDTDDDFILDCGNFIRVVGSTKKEVINNLIVALQNAKLIEGSRPYLWTTMRDEAIKSLQHGETTFSFCGNQTIEISVYKKKPSLDIFKESDIDSQVKSKTKKSI